MLDILLHRSNKPPEVSRAIVHQPRQLLESLSLQYSFCPKLTSPNFSRAPKHICILSDYSLEILQAVQAYSGSNSISSPYQINHSAAMSHHQDHIFPSTDDMNFTEDEFKFLTGILIHADVSFAKIQKDHFPNRHARDMERRWHGHELASSSNRQIFSSTDNDESTPEEDNFINEMRIKGKTLHQIQQDHFPARKVFESVSSRWYEINRREEPVSEDYMRSFIDIIDVSSFPMCGSCFRNRNGPKACNDQRPYGKTGAKCTFCTKYERRCLEVDWELLDTDYKSAYNALYPKTPRKMQGLQQQKAKDV